MGINLTPTWTCGKLKCSLLISLLIQRFKGQNGLNSILLKIINKGKAQTDNLEKNSAINSAQRKPMVNTDAPP